MYETVRFVSAGRFISRDNWLHQSRTINTHELIFALTGHIHMAVGEKSYTLAPGDVLHIAPGVPHRGTQVSNDSVSFYWVHYTGDTPPLPQFLQQKEASRTEILCKQLLHCINAEGYPAEIADCFVRIILMELFVQLSGASKPQNTLCSIAEEWIRGNCDRPIKVSDVADYVGFNADYLNRIFRRYHPEGLKAYINTMRCQKIRNDLVSTDLSLQQISQKYGFQDYKYFLKYFRFHEGITPTEFRNAYYKTHINWI